MNTTSPYFQGSTFTENDFTITLNKMWTIICGAMVFSMQIGFAFLEAGSIRKKSSHVVFYKLMLHSLIVVLTFWLTGYALAFSSAYNNFIGGKTFYAGQDWQTPESQIDEPTQYSNWVFQYSVAGVVVAITNGSISERTSLVATSIHTFLMTLFIYPVAIAWTWGGGWLTNLGFVDFSGSGVVHCTGAYAGLAGLLFVGPRYNRWKKFEDVCDMRTPEEIAAQKKTQTQTYQSILTSNTQRAEEEEIVIPKNTETKLGPKMLQSLRNKVLEEDHEAFSATNLTYTLFGGLFLWMGFIFYNAGSTIGVLKYQVLNGTMSPMELWKQSELAAVNTFIAGCSAGIFGLIFRHPLMNGWKAERRLRDDAAGVCNAYLAGMVACGAGMNDYEPWAAFVVGIIGCIFYLGLCKAFDHWEIDDAVEAFQLHGGGGTSGVMCAAFLTRSKGILYGWSGKIFAYQLCGWVCLAGWSFLCSALIWGTLKWLNMLRIDLKTEIVGYDFIEFADEYELMDSQLKLRDKKRVETK